MDQPDVNAANERISELERALMQAADALDRMGYHESANNARRIAEGKAKLVY